MYIFRKGCVILVEKFRRSLKVGEHVGTNCFVTGELNEIFSISVLLDDFRLYKWNCPTCSLVSEKQNIKYFISKHFWILPSSAAGISDELDAFSSLKPIFFLKYFIFLEISTRDSLFLVTSTRRKQEFSF